MTTWPSEDEPNWLGTVLPDSNNFRFGRSTLNTKSFRTEWPREQKSDKNIITNRKSNNDVIMFSDESFIRNVTND